MKEIRKAFRVWLAAFFCGTASLLHAGGGGSGGSGSATVSLFSPANYAAFAAPACLRLAATVCDTNGTVTNVAFYLGSTLLANVTTVPAQFTTANVFAGVYRLIAVVTDDQGATATSEVVSVTVTNTAALAALLQIKTVFVIPLENHDFVQAIPQASPQQLLGNPAAPYFNSLITPGNSNAAQVSFATHYFSAGYGEHPSEPNYLWSEAGTEFGAHTDNDPSPAMGNVFTNVLHLTGQMTAAGIPWRSYQEDLQYGLQFGYGPTGSVIGAPALTNIYNGTTECDYAVKHNPMEFFKDTQNLNCYPLTNFWTDLTHHGIGRYNWITPDIFNDMHSALPGGYAYHGVNYTGDQGAIAEGDNFLSIVIPQIMASAAYQSNGVIILWTDETVFTDDTNTSLPFIIISPLAKGNAYASTLPYSHSSTLKSMDEIFGLAYQTNVIPASEINAQKTGYNYVDGRSAVVNDLSDFFTGAPAVSIEPGVTTGSSNTNPGSSATTNTTTLPAQTVARTAAGFQWIFSGPSNQTYEVLATTNLALPQWVWTVISAGIFGGTNVVFTDTNLAGYDKRYYTVISP